MMNEPQKQRGPIAWMTNNVVAANLIMLFCLVGGVFSLSRIKQEVFPDITADIVQVSVPYPGASPEEVEQGIILAVEEGVMSLDGVDEVTATASEGMGTVMIEMIEGGNLQRLAQDVKSAVDRIITFPEEAEEPRVMILSRRRQVIQLVIYGDADEAVLHELAERARDELLQNPNITQVDLSGIRPLEISVEVSQENLRRYNLTLDDIARRLRATSIEMPGGGLKTRTGEILVRFKERRDYGWQFARTPIISAPDGTEVLLEDIAEIKDAYRDVDQYATFNGQRAVMIDVFRIGDQTPIQVSDAVREQLKDLRAMLPAGIQADIRSDRSDMFRQRASLLLRNGALGVMLVLFSLGLFLELRLAFWVMMGIPISFLGSLVFMPSLGVSVNMITMFAYIIAVGIVVDDAIIVGENVYYHHQQGMPFLQAAITGAREMVTPVTFSILTNIATFMPIFFVTGFMGKIFKFIPLIVCTTFIISLFESLFILPAHLGHHRDKKRHGLSGWIHARQQAFSRGFIRLVENVFGPFLDGVLKRRYLAVAVATAGLLIAFSYMLSGRMGFSMFPRTESEYSTAEAVLPYGSPIQRTEAVMRRLYDGARKVIDESGHPELVEGVYAELGEEGSHSLNMRVYLAPPKIRDKIMSNQDFTDRWREVVGPIAGLESLSFASDAGGPGRGPGLTVELSHRNIDVLDKASAALAQELRSFPYVADINDGFQPGKQQLDYKIKPEGESLGLTAAYVARQVRSSFYGAEVLRQQRGRNEIKVMVRLPEKDRVSEHTLDNLILRAPAGGEAPLRDVVEVTRGRAYTVINRRDGRRVVQVTADVTPRKKSEEIRQALADEDLPKLADRFPGLVYSFQGRQADMQESLQSLMAAFIPALFLVYALLAIPFRSYIQPLIVMISIPFGVIGAMVGHIIMGFSLSVISIFGIVALSGVVVNDALVLIDMANRRRREGMSAHDAVLGSAIQRFRPILLTTLTTFCGLGPMMFERARAARFLIPMAISLGFGILFATLITLLLVPSLYMVSDDFKRGLGFVGRAWRKLMGTLPDEELARVDASTTKDLP